MDPDQSGRPRLGPWAALFPSVLAKEAPKKDAAPSAPPPKVTRPSDLPVYEPDEKETYDYYVDSPGSMQSAVGGVRKSCEGALGQGKEFTQKCKDILSIGQEHTKGLVEILSDKENVAARAGAIAGGGLLGLLIGIRGGFIRKTFTTSLGASGAAAVLYPEEAKKVAEEAKRFGGMAGEEVYTQAVHVATIAYNFVVGMKPPAGEEGKPCEKPPVTSTQKDEKKKSLQNLGDQSEPRDRDMYPEPRK